MERECAELIAVGEYWSECGVYVDDYTQLPSILSAQGDADGDGVCNLGEYNAWNG